ncbi:MAG TPA: histidine phosphatase family protein, partial [Acidimicrobiales bacterium]
MPVLILVRHGESTANAQGLLLGRTDAELTENGRRQAAAARALVYDPVAEVRSSPLRRALDTAE